MELEKENYKKMNDINDDEDNLEKSKENLI